MDILSAPADSPRIFRLQVTLPDGRRRWRLVKCPNPRRDPGASLFGLDARLAELTLAGNITGQSISVPATITARQRDRLVRWDEALLAMLT